MTTTHRTEGRTLMRPITLGHKHDGGTGITNFAKEQAEIYREAIKLHGDPAMAISERDFFEGHELYFSLHDLSPEEREFGLGEFWAVFDLVKSLYATRKLFGVEHTGAANWVRHRDEHARLLAQNEALREAHEDMLNKLECLNGYLAYFNDKRHPIAQQADEIPAVIQEVQEFCAHERAKLTTPPTKA